MTSNNNIVGSVGSRNVESFLCTMPSFSLSPAFTHTNAQIYTFSVTHSLDCLKCMPNSSKASTPALTFYMLFVKWLQTYVDTHTPLSPPPPAPHLHTMPMRLQLNNNINNILCLFVVTAVATVSVHLFLFIANTTEWCLSVWFDMLRLQMPFQWMHLIRFWFIQTIR